jgi:UDP-glucose 4-epimerase
MTAVNRVLVTGGAGFIGSATVDLLLSERKQVVVLDSLYSGKLENLNLQHPDLEFIEGDILEYPLVESLLHDCDAVLHLAAIASVPLSIENPIYTLQVNTQGFLHILQAIHKSKRNIKLAYASSAAVYGEAKELPCREDMPLVDLQLSPYAVQKLHCEHYANLYNALHQVKSLGLRYFNVYGRRQDPKSPYSGVISRFLDAYQREEDLIIFGDGMQSRDFIHVSDVARANLLAITTDYTGVLNIATGQPQTLLQLVESLQTAGDKPAKLQFEPARIGDIRASYAMTKLAETALHFTYSKSLQDGMRELFEN